jgi:exosortase E/protease (VPEID-CTERM system)
LLLACLCLPVAEAVVLSLRFDVGALASTPGLAADVVRLMPMVVRGLIAAVAGCVMAALVRRGETWPLVRDGLRARHRRLGWALSHAASIGLLYLLTERLIEGPSAPGPRGEALVLFWLAVGGLAALTWCGLLFAASTWRVLVARLWPIGAVGVGVGVAGLALSRFSPRLWAPMTEMTFRSVRGLLELMGVVVVSDPAAAVLGTARFRVQIAAECSGYEGLGLMAGYLAALLFTLRHRLRFPRAWLLIPLGLGAIWVANVARIASLILIGDRVSRSIALGGFHSQAGWIAFNVIGLTLLVVAIRSSWFSRVESNNSIGLDTATSPTTAYLAPFLALIGAGMVTGAMSGGFDRLYAVRVLLCLAALWAYRSFWIKGLMGVSWSWAMGVGVAVFAVWMALEPSGVGPEAVAHADAGRALRDHVWSLSEPERYAWLLARVLGSVLVVPLAEELAFRGYGLRRLIQADFESVRLSGRAPLLALLLSSLLFGALHGRWLAGVIAGLAFGWVYGRRGRLADAVLAHATANALIALWALGLGAWSLWS